MIYFNSRVRHAALLAFSSAAFLSNAAHAVDVHVLATGALSGAFKELGRTCIDTADFTTQQSVLTVN